MPVLVVSNEGGWKQPDFQLRSNQDICVLQVQAGLAPGGAVLVLLKARGAGEGV